VQLAGAGTRPLDQMQPGQAPAAPSPIPLNGGAGNAGPSGGANAPRPTAVPQGMGYLNPPSGPQP
jgi:hypothetical protein